MEKNTSKKTRLAHYGSLIDIAAEAGVSVSTVSNVIHHKLQRVSPEVYEKVVAILAKNTGESFSTEMNPDPKSNNIALAIFQHEKTIFYSPVIQLYISKLERLLKEKDYALHLCFIKKSLSNHKELPALLRSGKVDGILISGMPTANQTQFFYNLGIPLVFLSNAVETRLHTSIQIDNIHGAFQAVEHLYQHGHKEIGFVSGRLNANTNFAQRFLGFKKAMQHFKRVVRRPFVLEGSGLNNAYELCLNLFDSKKFPTALFCVNDQNAIHARQAIDHCGLSVPEDVSLIGFDNISASQNTNPALTTIDHRFEHFVEKAVELLFKNILKRSAESYRLVIDCKLVIRDSVASI